MSTKNPVAIGLAVTVAVVLTACGSATVSQTPPATVTKIAGSSVQQIRLTDQAIHRLGIAAQPVREATVAVAGRAGVHKIIPYSAVVYDTDGSTWTYVNTAARTYVRQPIKIDEIQGDTAVLADGPAPGAAVVTVGAPELLGTEYNISGEE